MFYQPLELFVIHFGFLPWLVWSLKRFLGNGKRQDLLLFGSLNLLGVSQAHVPTVFVVYLLAVLVIMIGWFLGSAKGKDKRIVAVIGALVVVHSFWALPYAYSVVKNASVIAAAKMNRLSNKETVMRNAAFGDFKSVALLRGFQLDFEDWQHDQVFDYQMKPWREFWALPGIEAVAWGLWGLSLVGGLVIMLGKKQTVVAVCSDSGN